MNSELKSSLSLLATIASVIGTAMPSPTNTNIWPCRSATVFTMVSASKSRNISRWPPRLTKVSRVNRPAPCMSGAETTTRKPPSGLMCSATSAGLWRLSPYGLPPDRHA